MPVLLSAQLVDAARSPTAVSGLAQARVQGMRGLILDQGMQHWKGHWMGPNPNWFS